MQHGSNTHGSVAVALAPGVSAVAAAAVLIFVASIPLEYSWILPGVGSITRVIGVVMLLTVALDLPLSGRVRETPAVFHLLLAFVLWSLASICWSADQELSVARSVTYVQLFLMTWVVWQYARNEHEVAHTMQAFVVGSLIVAVVTIRDFRAINLAGLVVNDLRVSAFGQNPNETGLMLVVALPLALTLLRRSSSRWLQILNGVYLVLGSVAVILTASRGAFVALGVCGVLMFTVMRQTRGFRAGALLTLLALVLVGAGVVVSLVPQETWGRLGSIATMVQRLDFNNRVDNWAAGLNAFAEQPIIGVGAGAFEGATAHSIVIARSSHSTWLGIVVETGLVGAALWYAAIASMVLTLRQAEIGLRRTLIAATVPMAVGMAILGWDHRKVPWLIFAFCLCAGAAHASRGAARLRGSDVATK